MLLPMNFFSQFTSISVEWAVGAFVGATLDYFFNVKMPASHLLRSLIALVQLTLATALTHETLYYIGQRKPNQIIANTMWLPIFIYVMSPNAATNLVRGYLRFHKFLYGEITWVQTYPPPDTTIKTADTHNVSSSSSCKCKE